MTCKQGSFTLFNIVGVVKPISEAKKPINTRIRNLTLVVMQFFGKPPVFGIQRVR